jgi:hypothetical protein
MTEAEALEVIAVLAALFPGQVPPETTKAWGGRLAALTGVERDDGMWAAKELAAQQRRPVFADLRDYTLAAASSRRRATDAAIERKHAKQRHQLPGRTSRNPAYPRAALRVVEWVAAERRAGREPTAEDTEAAMERALREMNEANVGGKP